MLWIIERLANNLDTLTGVFDILSGVRRLLFACLLLTFCGCTYSIRERTDAIGDSTTSYSLSWAASSADPAPQREYQPRQHISRRRAQREEMQAEASPLGSKWFK